MYRTAAAFMMVLLGIAASAAAQTKPAQPGPPRPAPPPAIDRIYISVNGAFQTAGDDFGENVTFT